uniref:Bm8445 n=1 Tax=Brugia malayi TaxID=6279 RepID=A0A1I9GCL6_BRUMA|nr:Bm8445 [Brugia malayi]
MTIIQSRDVSSVAMVAATNMNGVASGHPRGNAPLTKDG